MISSHLPEIFFLLQSSCSIQLPFSAIVSLFHRRLIIPSESLLNSILFSLTIFSSRSRSCTPSLMRRSSFFETA